MSLPAPLLLITSRALCPRPLPEVAAAALAGGCRWLLLREKDLAPAALATLAGELAALARPCGAALCLSGNPALAAELGLAGVHLPQGQPVGPARALLGPGALLGVSAHSAAEALAAAREGADYVTLSPIFSTPSKPGYGPALGLGLLAQTAAGLPIPVVALGGVGPRNAGACRAAGAAAVAVMGGVMAAADPEDAARRLVRTLTAKPGDLEG
jgi:thiamine-phosphate pyrophosphorylase